MKMMKHIALGAMVTLSAFCTVLYSSCAKEGCSGVTCLNKAQCGGGICSCITGTGGTNCEIVYRKLYANTYTGDPSGNGPLHSDSVNTLIFQETGDTTDFSTMTVSWYDTGVLVKDNIALKLSNNSASGSSFTIDYVDGRVQYKGGGSISSTVVTMELNIVDTLAARNEHYFFSGFYKR